MLVHIALVNELDIKLKVMIQIIIKIPSYNETHRFVVLEILNNTCIDKRLIVSMRSVSEEAHSLKWLLCDSCSTDFRRGPYKNVNDNARWSIRIERLYWPGPPLPLPPPVLLSTSWLSSQAHIRHTDHEPPPPRDLFVKIQDPPYFTTSTLSAPIRYQWKHLCEPTSPHCSLKGRNSYVLFIGDS